MKGKQPGMLDINLTYYSVLLEFSSVSQAFTVCSPTFLVKRIIIPPVMIMVPKNKLSDAPHPAL